MAALPLHTMQDAQGTPYVPETQWAGERTSAIDSTYAVRMLSYWWFFISICVCEHMHAQQNNFFFAFIGNLIKCLHMSHLVLTQHFGNMVSYWWFVCITQGCNLHWMLSHNDDSLCARLHAGHRRPFASNSEPGHLISLLSSLLW